MRITINARRRLAKFRPLEPLESRVLLAATPYALVKSIPMTGAVKNGTGAQPAGLVMAPDGDLYGVTQVGGKRYGTVFKISGTSQTLTTVATFDGKNGISPRGGLVFDDAGDLFGTAIGGGADGFGVVWEITADSLASTASTITPVFSFAGANGAFPISGLYADGLGNFFGYTEGKLSSNKERAVVFEVSPSGTSSAVTTVATFDNKTLPSGGLTFDSSGNIFGETRNGGNKKAGTVFEITASSSTITTLATFNGTNGAAPNGTLVIDNSGNIFGTTLVGGAHSDGTIFKIDTSGSAPLLTTVVSFNGPDGYRPVGDLILDGDGNLFGVTAGGGGNAAGSVFEWSTTGTSSTTTVLYRFRGINTGTTPSGPLLMNGSGQFFGTTFTGGKNNLGTVFEIEPNVV